MNRSPKVREVITRLSRLGCRRIRSNGSHEIWEAPNGQRCPIVINHRGADMSPHVLASVRRWLRQSGLDLEGGF
jgi:predicted RNA binding protein YcfA (HicA-like mRNA interferase family)